jgi:threonine/homoserine/homoserine lactone efflux protein
MSLEFLITALIVVLVPGTGVVYTVAVGLGKGRQAAIAAAFGCTLGIIPAILASVIGLAALMHTSALVFTAVKYAGVAYLLYLAWQTLKEGGVFMAMTFAVFIVYGMFAALVGEKVLRSDMVMLWMRRAVATAFAGFGLRLALAEQ